MSDNDRIDRLEQRLMRLEGLMREVLRALPGREGEELPPAPAAAPRPEQPKAAPAAPAPVEAPPRRLPPLPPPRPKQAPAGPSLDGEQWVGQRGLLAVGVIAVILAAGYLLKLSFDRGWISPMARCVGGVIVGVIFGGLGWRLDRKGYRLYGPALVGTGAAIAYVAVWAASRWYGFLEPIPGMTGMAIVALVLALLAWKMNAEALASVAVLGAFFAPIVIGSIDADADLLLVYLALIGMALGSVVWARGWRITALLICLSFFGLGLPTSEDATPLVALAFGALGGGAGLALGLKRNWWETRFFAFWGGWGCLAFASQADTAWLVLLAGVLLSLPVWLHAVREDGVWPFEEGAEGRREGRASRRPLLPSIYFYITPLWLVWAITELPFESFEIHNGLATGIVAVAHLAIAFWLGRRPFAVVGTVAAAFAVLAQWHDVVTAPGALGLLALAWGSLGRMTRRVDWNYHALLPVILGLLTLWTGMTSVREAEAAAFIDPWALVCWGLVVVMVALARDLSAPEEDEPSLRVGVLWVLSGVVLLLGVTGELTRYFGQTMGSLEAGRLAGGLAVSVWWLLFAGGCILGGFRLGIRPLRIAGLWVSGFAVLKVILVDLSTLDALYRVGSVFGLGLVSLLVAWGYHRRARSESDAIR
jgi:uncharacterized membrane protein